MKILIMGGTGAMGQELVPLLGADSNNQLVVTSRKKKVSEERVKYIQGDAKNFYFIKPVLEDGCFDVIVDFMLYSVDEFKDRFELLLNSCRQYLFFSSARVYAASDKPISEETDRLLDVTDDQEFLDDFEYSLTKAKEEDILKTSSYKNWVIIRPYKTYSNNRLQLGVLELEQWLYRAVTGKFVVVPGEIKDLHTSLTYSKDTARILKEIIGKTDLNGETVQIANPQRITWGDVIQVYSKCIENQFGRRMKVYYAKDTSDIELSFNNKYRIKYDGLIDRIFDDRKVVSLMGGVEFSWTPLNVGLEQCMKSALSKGDLTIRNYGAEGMFDRITGEFTNLSTIPGFKMRIKYLLHRMVREKTIKRIKKLIHR